MAEAQSVIASSRIVDAGTSAIHHEAGVTNVIRSFVCFECVDVAKRKPLTAEAAKGAEKAENREIPLQSVVSGLIVPSGFVTKSEQRVEGGRAVAEGT